MTGITFPLCCKQALIEQEAFKVFLQYEPARKQMDFFQAITDCGVAFIPIGPNHPMLQQINARAQQRWLDRKDEDAKRDWKIAEDRVNEMYVFV